MLELCLSPEETQGENAHRAAAERGPLRGRFQAFAHDWALPAGAWWLSAQEIAEGLRVSRRHVFHLILDGSFDCALDLRAPGAGQSYWRVWRPAFLRFGQRARGEAVGRVRLETEWSEGWAAYPATLTGLELAAHFRCSKQHIYNVAGEWANVGSLEAGRALVRVSKAEALAWTRKRMV